MKNQITFFQALEGYFLHADARRLSPHTIADYTNIFRKFQAFLGDDPPIAEITADQVRTFLASCDHLSKKTLLNYHTGLSALWTWAVSEDLVEQHILRRVIRPKPEEPAIKPYTRDDIEAMLAVCSYTQPHTMRGKHNSRRSRPTALRDRAIIKTLVDTGIRASELCKITIADMDKRNKRIFIWGKGAKERTVYIDGSTPRPSGVTWPPGLMLALTTHCSSPGKAIRSIVMPFAFSSAAWAGALAFPTPTSTASATPSPSIS
jgi:site-specific recombinase XerD